ncbi:MAG: PRTRC system protein C [Salinisphaeraceae bacterium]
MSDVTVNQLTRVFRYGSLELDDPAPEKSPLEAMRLYAGSYPIFQQAALGAETIEGDKLVFEIEKPAAKTKG